MISHLLALAAGVVIGSFLPVVKTAALAVYAFVKSKVTKTPATTPPPAPPSA